MKPKILVTSAAGHTGSATTLQLLKRGFQVRAFVRRHDPRAERLAEAGAEIFVGDLLDIRDVRRALVGVKRAYSCPPFAPNTLHSSMLFAIAAEEARLETAALLTAWNPHPSHPAIHQREHWLSNQVHRWMPTVNTVHVNPGLFAFPYFFGLPAAAHFGTLLLPFGEGLNAPPSNEDIAAVVAEILTNPEPHVGRTYRPTGPRLLSGHDAAVEIGRALGREVRYRDVPTPLFLKAAKAQGFGDFELSHFRHYADEVRGGTYAKNAPNDHVELVTGRPAEEFEVTARRYVSHPELVQNGLAIGNRVGALGAMIRTILTRLPDLDRWESERGYPLVSNGQLAHENEEWRASAGKETSWISKPSSVSSS